MVVKFEIIGEIESIEIIIWIKR